MLSLTSIPVAALLLPAVSGTEASGIQASAASALEIFRQEHGSSWSVIADEETGHAGLLYGGRAQLGGAARTDADFSSLALTAVSRTAGIHGVDPSTLDVDEVVFLPLYKAGTTDKMTVSLAQSLGGVPVNGGGINVLFDVHGRLLSIEARALVGAQRLRLGPALSSTRAIAVADRLFAADTGLAATRISTPSLRIEQVAGPNGRRGVLVWEVDVTWESDGFQPEAYRYEIDARRGSRVSRYPLIHNLDISGTVVSNVTPGVLPDTLSNPPELQPMPFIEVSDGTTTVTADELGNFVIPGASAPAVLTVSYYGSFADSMSPGSRHTVAHGAITDAGNTIEMNPTKTQLDTAEANAYNWINRLRQWTRSVNPADGKADFRALSRANLPAACNAFYTSAQPLQSVNFFADSGACPNSAYSSVVLHEMGHWMNDRYKSGNNLDGFGEGNADVFSMYVLDDPIVGRDFQLGNPVRDGNNTAQLCNDGTTRCYSEAHDAGQVLMGALWKVRRNLKTKHGVALGGARADVLFNSWMNAYNARSIRPGIETQWLTLDDNDGYLANGTPNFQEIDGGFREQGFPGEEITDPDYLLYGDRPEGGPTR